MRYTDALLESQMATYRYDTRRQRVLAETGARSARSRWTREAQNPFDGVVPLCRNIF